MYMYNYVYIIYIYNIRSTHSFIYCVIVPRFLIRGLLGVKRKRFIYLACLVTHSVQ